MEAFEDDIIHSLEVLRNGGVILYPTDTIWGLGCDATSESAVQKIFGIKQRVFSKSMIVLVADEREVLQYVASPDLSVFDFLEEQDRPTSVVFEHALGLPQNLISRDGSVAIRIVQDRFCRHLIKRFGKPIVLTSANISGDPAPMHFSEISTDIKSVVDYVVRWRQNDDSAAHPSQIIKWENGQAIYLRQ